jgi:hypothetical protein
MHIVSFFGFNCDKCALNRGKHILENIAIRVDFTPPSHAEGKLSHFASFHFVSLFFFHFVMMQCNMRIMTCDKCDKVLRGSHCVIVSCDRCAADLGQHVTVAPGCGKFRILESGGGVGPVGMVNWQ